MSRQRWVILRRLADTTDKNVSNDISRRFFIASAGVCALPIITGCSATANLSATADLPDLTLPEENLSAMLRMQASLIEEDVPWWFDGTIFAIVGESEPKPLVRFQGWEVYWVRPLGDGTYELTGNTTTFYYDHLTGDRLDTFANPYTGQTNTVTPSVQGGGAGYGFNYSVDGVRPTRFLDKMPDKALRLQWSSVRDVIWMHTETAYPPGLSQPRKQRQTVFARIEDFVDPTVRNIPATFTSTVFQPWPKWMEMAEKPGHAIWHASGAKIGSLDDLPAEFRARLEAEHPERMTAYPFAATEKKSDFQ